MKNKVLVIVGPTASGKSDLAVRLAKKFNGEIISADSRQVYKGLNIGSGKITKPEMKGIKHYLLDVADPKKRFSASNFTMLTNSAIAKIINKGKIPIIAGGTGFYIDAVTGAVNIPEVPPNKLLRKKLEKLDKETLFKMLLRKDLERAKTIDKNNKIRLVRALEIAEKLGKTPVCRRGRSTRYRYAWIGIKPTNLDEKIKVRLEKRWAGIVREVKKLHAQGLTWKRMFELGLEYRYVSLHVRGKLSKDEAFGKLFTETKRYAKRQMTYWKRNPKIKWFTLSPAERFTPKEFSKIEKSVQNMLG